MVYVEKFYATVVFPLLTADSGGAATIGTPTELATGWPRQLLGYPVQFVSIMSTAEANSQICCFLGDLSQGVYLGERRRLEIAKSSDVFFTSDEVAVRATERFGINIFDPGYTCFGPSTTARYRLKKMNSYIR